jgi:hypothetical protein
VPGRLTIGQSMMPIRLDATLTSLTPAARWPRRDRAARQALPYSFRASPTGRGRRRERCGHVDCSISAKAIAALAAAELDARADRRQGSRRPGRRANDCLRGQAVVRSRHRPTRPPSPMRSRGEQEPQGEKRSPARHRAATMIFGRRQGSGSGPSPSSATTTARPEENWLGRTEGTGASTRGPER